MIFVEKVRDYRYTKGISIEEAVELAIDDCLKECVLSDILLRQKAEVKKMCITEFDEEVYKQGIKEEYEEEKAELRKVIAARDELLEEKDALLEEKDALLETQASGLAEKDELLGVQAAEIARLKALLQEKK